MGTRTDVVVSDHIYRCRWFIIYLLQKILTAQWMCKLFINSSEVRNNHYDIVIGKGANVNIQVEQGDINMNALDVSI